MRLTLSTRGLLSRFLLALLSIVILALVIFYLAMQPRGSELQLMALFLTTTSVITLFVGYVAYQLGWISRAPSLRWALISTYLISSILTFMNVWLTARLMFVSEHDLLLGTILLGFASGIALALGYFFTETLMTRITKLKRTVREVRQGALEARAEIDGQDEITELAEAFNSMVAQVETAVKKQQELDALRKDLITWVGHDLQTPLASIRAIVEALADGLVDDPATRARYLNSAKHDIKALSSLIDDLFELAQLDAGGLRLDVQPNSLSDLISDTLESFSARADELGIVLTGEIDENVDPVRMDVSRIGRVLNNLMTNALRHTPEKGEIHLSAKPSYGTVEVEVRDTGEGFSEEDLPHLFERFYRGEKSRNKATGGVGLGLAIAKGLVEAHGGTIRADLLPESGARFVFTLPK
jgi:signal transduction histidine kinase